MSNPTGQNPKPDRNSGALIYVVDDEPMLLELASAILEPLGYRVTTFRDPEQALEAYRTAQPRPDLLITDYAMHSMNGMQLITHFRGIDPHQKILLVSGTVREDVYRDTPVKPDDFLAKPYQAQQLIGFVKSLLEQK